MGKRVDNIVLLPNAILVLEFKVGATKYPKQAKTQTIDYCLDLLNFHAGSHGKKSCTSIGVYPSTCNTGELGVA